MNGYGALEKDKIHVEFLLIDQNRIARVSWKPPAGTDSLIFVNHHVDKCYQDLDNFGYIS